MEKLMKPAEYAKELGISRQAVYAKIKRGILKTKDVEGKLYIIVDKNKEPRPSKEESATEPSVSTVQQNRKVSSSSEEDINPREYQRLLAAKDETIAVLKGTVEDLKESNRQMSSTLKGEIDLLKSAFSEMRSLYMHRIEQMQKIQPLGSNTIVEADISPSDSVKALKEWIGIKKFFKRNGIEKEKTRKKILHLFTSAYKKGDKRFSEIDGKLKVNAAERFTDILESV